MSYTTIEILGKQRGIKFNNYALEKMGEKLLPDSTASLGYAAVWGGLLGNMYIKGEQPDFTFEQLVDAIDALPNMVEVLEQVAACLNESQAWQSAVKRGEDEQKKKAIENTPTTI